MTTHRLPTPGQDDGTWGNVLNDFLSQSINSDGTLKSSAVASSGAATDSTVVHNSGNETVDGTKTFSSSPVVPSPTLGSQATNKTYVDTAVTAGAPDASTSTKGITKLSTAPVSASSPIAAGDNDPRLSDQRTPTDGSVTDTKIASGGLTNAAISPTAAIVRTKLDSSTQTSLTKADNAVPTTQLGAASGVATLDSGTHLTASQLPSSVVSISQIPVPRVSATANTIHPTAAYPTGSNIGHESRQRHRSAVAGRGVKLTYYLNYGIGEGSIPAGVDRVFNAAIEYPAGTFYECFSSDGKQKPSFSPNGIGKLYCDGVEIPANTDFWVRSHTLGLSSDAVVAASNADGVTEYGVQFTVDQDHTLTVSSQPATNTNPMFGPQCVSIQPYTRVPSVVGVFDSIGMGRGDPDANAASVSTTPGGWFGRALSTNGSGRMSPKLPSLMLGIASETAANLAGGTSRRHRFALLDEIAPTYAFVMLGTNDLVSNAASVVEPLLVLIWQQLASRGASVFATTLPPTGTSTDSFATLANQTTASDNAQRVLLNNWIRAGSPIDPSSHLPVAVGTSGALVAGNVGHPLCTIVHPNGGAGYIEAADPVESSRDSGKWKVDGTAFKYTIDGTHPSTFGHTAIAANINNALLV